MRSEEITLDMGVWYEEPGEQLLCGVGQPKKRR